VAKQNALLKAINDQVLKAASDPSGEVELSTSLDSMTINPDETPAAVADGAPPAPESATTSEKVPVNSKVVLTEELITDTIKSVKRSDLGIVVNPNVFVDLKNNAEGDAAEDDIARVNAHKEEDEGVARDLASFLWSTVIPLVVDDIRSQNTIIHDGEALVSYLHRNGVNLRYLGRLASLAREQEKIDIDFASQEQLRLHPMPKYWLELLEIEMIARVVKHIFRENMQSNAAAFNSPAGFLADVLNFVLGTSHGVDAAEEKSATTANPSQGNASGKKKHAKKTGKKSSPAIDNEGDFGAFAAPVNVLDLQSSAPFTRAEFWAQLLKKVVSIYGAPLSLFSSDDGITNLSSRVCKVTLLRRICQQLGVQVATVDYDFDSADPFGHNDIYRFMPRVKSSTGDVISVHVTDLLVSAASFVEAGNYAAASSIYQQITILVQQVEGNQSKILCPVNDGFAKCLIQMGHIAPAISVYEKNLSLAIQTSGLDSVQTLQQHLYLANLYISVDWNNSAIRHLQTVAYLVGVLGGYNHPEIITSIILLARAYAGNKDFGSAISCLFVARHRLEAAGEQVKAASILQDIAELYAAAEEFAEASNCQKQAYMLIRQMYGESDSRTIEAKKRCEAILRSTHAKALETARQRQQDEKTVRAKDRQKWLEDEDDDVDDAHKSGGKSSKKASGKKAAPKKK
jgi:protein TIF31